MIIHKLRKHISKLFTDNAVILITKSVFSIARRNQKSWFNHAGRFDLGGVSSLAVMSWIE